MKELFGGFKHKIKNEKTFNEEKINEILADKSVIISEDTKRKNRIPPGQHEVNAWPVLQAGSVQKIETSKWKFRIFGLVMKK